MSHIATTTTPTAFISSSGSIVGIISVAIPDDYGTVTSFHQLIN